MKKNYKYTNKQLTFSIQRKTEENRFSINFNVVIMFFLLPILFCK